MSIFRNLFARSEQWRLEWGCRNCISVAFVTFLYLYAPTKHHLARYGVASTSYATVVTTFVKDVTIGATLTNAWNCLLGVFNATIFSWIYFLIVRMYYVDSVPLLVTLLTICISTFVFQYLEMVPMTKKFSVGVIPIYLINNRNMHNPSFFIWGMFLGAMIGCGCALIGCVLPFPIRLASTELRERIEYYSVSMSSLIKDLTHSWFDAYRISDRGDQSHFTQGNTSPRLGTTRSDSNAPIYDSNMSSSPRLAKRNICNSTTNLLDTDYFPANERPPFCVRDPSVRTENAHWRKLRLLLSTIGAFKYRQYEKSSGSFHSDPRRKYNTRYLRMELVNYLQETLPYLQSRNLETGFGFTRRVGNRCAKFVKLIQDILLIITNFEGHIESMEKSPEFHYLYEAFFSRSNLHYGFALYVQSIVDVIMSISVVLVEQSVLDDQLLTPGNEGFRAVAAAAKLIRARKYFDAEYLKARRDLFYPQTEPGQYSGERSPASPGANKPPPPPPAPVHHDAVASGATYNPMVYLARSEGQLQNDSAEQEGRDMHEGAGTEETYNPMAPLASPTFRKSTFLHKIQPTHDTDRAAITFSPLAPLAPVSSPVRATEKSSPRTFQPAVYHADVLGPPPLLGSPTPSSAKTLLQRGKVVHLKQKALPADTKAMLDVNSIIFLLDTLSRLLLEFWSANDLVQMSRHDWLNPIASSVSANIPDEPLLEEGDTDLRNTRTIFWKNVYAFAGDARSFVWELFPTNQAHLIPQRHPTNPILRWVLTDTIKQRFAMAAKVSVAMTIGAFYGIIANRPSPHLASMTVAFLAGGTVTGINVMTCINRAAGTAVACVYSIMVAYITTFWKHDWERDLFVGFAVVLLQLPCTYVRSYPLYSYSGVVTGFTCVMILLARNISTEFAVNRIIDSYVGVALFLFIELMFAARFTEDELLGDMKRVFTGVQDRFINMHRNFQFFNAAEDSIADVRARVRGGTLTPFDADEEMKRIEALRVDMQNRKALEVDSIHALIRRQLQLGPFYRSEPAIWRPVVFPTSLLEESVALQKQAADSIQIMIWAVMTCDGTFDGRIERMISKLDRKIKRNGLDDENVLRRVTSKGSDLSGYIELTYTLEPVLRPDSRSSSPIISQLDSPLDSPLPSPIPILPEFKSLLLPLEPHFIEVERFVCAVLTLLANSMEHICDWKPALKKFRDPIEIPCLTQPVPTEYSRRHRPNGERSVDRASSTLTQLSAVAEARYNAYAKDISGDFQHRVYERLTHGRDDAFNAKELGSLHTKYKRVVFELQQGLATEGSHRPGSSRIFSNREVVIVNTLITSTQQLIEALHGLTNVVSRMQAHRDIHVTQDGKRL